MQDFGANKSLNIMPPRRTKSAPEIPLPSASQSISSSNKGSHEHLNHLNASPEIADSKDIQHAADEESNPEVVVGDGEEEVVDLLSTSQEHTLLESRCVFFLFICIKGLTLFLPMHQSSTCDFFLAASATII